MGESMQIPVWAFGGAAGTLGIIIALIKVGSKVGKVETSIKQHSESIVLLKLENKEREKEEKALTAAVSDVKQDLRGIMVTLEYIKETLDK